jgi:hypothetical protein
MDHSRSMELDSSLGQTESDPCLGLREGEILRASVHEVTPEGGVRLGLMGVQTWVRSEAAIAVGDQLELLVRGHGSGIHLQILEDGEGRGDTGEGAPQISLYADAVRALDLVELESYHDEIGEHGDLVEDTRRRKECGALAALPLPAAPSGAWSGSGIYFSFGDTGEQLVLHLCPGQEGELRVDFHVGEKGLGISAEARTLADLESLRELLPEFEEALADMDLDLWAGAIRGGLGRPIAVLDLSSPRADGRSHLDEEG